MSRPKHPGMYPIFNIALHAADLEKQRKQWIIDAINYITAIEQERDEATELLDVTSSALSEWCRTPMHRVDRMVEETYTINAKIAELLERIEGGDNVG